MKTSCNMSEVIINTLTSESLVDEVLVKSVNVFKETIDASELFYTENLIFNVTENYGTVVIPMRRQYMIEEFTKELIKLFDVNILYTINRDNNRVWKTITYSKPVHKQMFIIGLISEMYGIVENIIVTFFNSIEKMFPWLCDNLQETMKSKDNIIYAKEMPILYHTFM